ncbi:MAG: WD40 repeat domain-containing serine/threonine protein kinase [Gemmataceae bacterium]
MNDLTPEQRLWQLWRQGRGPDVRAFLANCPGLAQADVVAVISVDQYERWQRGERPLAEDYIALIPPGPGRDQAACDVVYGEYLMREQLGEHPESADFRRRFPEQAAGLARQLEVHRALAAQEGEAAPAEQARPAVPGYELMEEVGRGGMGVVYRARQMSLDRDVALKVLRIPDDDPTMLERMQREAQITARLAHPRIVGIFDAGRAGPHFFFAMELVLGTDLQRRVSRDGPLSVADAVTYLRQAAEALAHAHAAGMVHRDIKPSNLMISPAGVKLLDMGLARQAGAAGDSKLTQAGVFMGTPDYIAPEQANDARRADARSDLYSLGCTFFYAVTGKPPYEGDTPLAKLMQHHAGPVASPLKHRPDLPPALVGVLARLMAKNPDDRFPSGEAVVRALAEPARPARAAVRAELVHRLQAGTDWVKGVAFSPDGRWLATAGVDRRLRLWNVFNGNVGWETQLPAALLCLAFSPEGRSLAVGGEDGTVWLFDVTARREAWHTAGDGENINALTFAARGTRLVGAAHDGSLRVWEMTAGKERRRWAAHAGAAWGVSATPDGSKVVSAGQDRTLKVWDVLGGAERARWPELAAVPSCVAVSPDGGRVLAGLADGSVGVWALADQAPVQAHDGHAWKVGCVAWSADGTRFLSGGRDHAVRLWEVGAADSLAKLTEHTRWVTCAAWCAGEPLFATGGADRTVCVWRVEG